MDGEDEPVPPADVDAHLAGCAACAAWRGRAEALTRRLRVRPAVSTPDLAAAVLAADPPGRAGSRARAALVVVAVLQMGVVLSHFLGPGSHVGHADPGHLFNEGVAWNAALAVGMLMAAVRTEQARGLLTTLTAFVAVLVAYSVYDLVTSAATPVRVLSHLPLLAGLALLHAVNRAHTGHPAPADTADTDHSAAGTGPPGPRAIGTGPRRMRPTAHRRAA